MNSEDLSYDQYLTKPCDPAEIVRMSKLVFIEGHLEMVDDLLLVLLPLAHLVYYKNIRYLDDREYAKEDLISDAIVNLYQDITLRWDKYIHVESYYTYFSNVLRNSMISLVHSYHNYYSQDELDPESIKSDEDSSDAYDAVDMQMMRDSLEEAIASTSRRILSCRSVNTNLLLSIFDCIYVKKSGLGSLSSRVRVFGISSSLFNFYVDHVGYVYRLAYNYQYALIGGKDKMALRIEDTISRFEDVTYRILSNKYYDTIIPEIYAEFGSDIAKKFVKTFSGRNVQVPRYQDFCDDLLGGVVVALTDGNKDNLYKVADEYKIPYRTIARIYNKAIKFDGVGKGEKK